MGTEVLDKREFEVKLASGEKRKFTTRMATNEEIQDSEFEYSKIFNKAIMNGILPQATLMSKLIENEIWSQAKDDAIEDQKQKVIKYEEAIGKDISEEKAKEISEELKEERQKLFNMRQEKNNLLGHSAEAKADEVQRNFLVSRVTEYADTKKRVWSDFKDYIKEQDADLLFRSVYEYLTFVNGLPSDFGNAFGTNDESKPEEKAEESTEDKEKVEHEEMVKPATPEA